MNTVGTMLKEARVAKGISLVDVEKQTKIRLKFLEAIEQDAYHLLPSPVYAKGFVKNYSEFLGLDSSVIMAFLEDKAKMLNDQSFFRKKQWILVVLGLG